MPQSSTASVSTNAPFPTRAGATGDGSDQPDRRARQLGLLIRAVGLAILPINALEILVGLAYGEWRALALGVATTAFAIWLLRLSQGPETLQSESTITRLATATLGLIAAAAVLEPAISVAMAITALLPGVLVLPFLSRAAVGRILVIVGVVGIGSVVAGEVVPRSDLLPSGSPARSRS